MEQTPWFVPWSIDFLNERLEPHFRAFEWGSGWSTIWLAARCDSVVSVENLTGWVDEAHKRIELYGLKNVEMIHIDKDSGGRWADYAAKILDYPDEHFHVISVDGRNRVKCIEYAIPKLAKGGGLLILDDSQRDHYLPGIALMKDWTQAVFFIGPHPSNPQGKATTVWSKPK
jgi:predicted O-methyltransferase YrrM